jgi:hypothetical protein
VGFQYPDTKISVPYHEDAHGVVEGTSTNPSKPVRVFTDRKPFSVGRAWEFMFYNRNIPAKKNHPLQKKVVETVRKYRQSDGTFQGEKLLQELKSIYIKAFGSSGSAQNGISLVTYAGPVSHPKLKPSHIFGRILPVEVGTRTGNFHAYDWALFNDNNVQLSIGYFGDFPLKPLRALSAIRSHFTQSRWDQLQVVQIPHHGSALSWFPNAAREFHHLASVISSARCSKHHPSQEVLDDLSKHGLVFVNEYQRLAFNGEVRYSK